VFNQGRQTPSGEHIADHDGISRAGDQRRRAGLPKRNALYQASAPSVNVGQINNEDRLRDQRGGQNQFPVVQIAPRPLEGGGGADWEDGGRHKG